MINQTFQKSVARTDEEERQRILEETVIAPKPATYGPDELENTHGLKRRLIEESESEEAAAVRYAEEAQRVRSGPKGNWALADQLEETAKRLRGSAMQKRRRSVAHDIQNAGQGTSFTPYNVPY
jgi:ribonuclease D